MSVPNNPYGQPPPPPNPYQTSATAPGSGYGPGAPNSALGVASLICGVGSIVVIIPACCCCGLLAPLTFPLPLAAIVLGFIAQQKSDQQGKNMGIAGIVCGAVAILLIIILVIMMFANPALIQQLQQMQNQ